MVIGICDDSLEMREYYSELFETIIEEEKILANIRIFKSGDQVIFDMDNVLASVDILFLDVKMPGISGIEVAKKLRERGYGGEIVFLTHSKSTVFSAFDVKAFHYIVKDVTSSEKVREILLESIKTATEKKSEYIVLTGIGGHRSIRISQISSFEVMGKVVTVYYDNDKSYEFISTINKLETQLFNKGFVRVSRSALVSVVHIKSYKYNCVIMQSGEEFVVGRNYFKGLKDAMDM